MSERIEIKNSAIDPLHVMVEKTSYVWEGFKMGADLVVKIGVIAGLYAIARKIGEALPYLKQIAENGMQK
ncbi:MAG: hypothetical protein LBD94_01675 [Rickettsiales bacterium]|jgi:hypothetical protein|nr:hypothetical protein [Rickettsiales bacterium]